MVYIVRVNANFYTDTCLNGILYLLPSPPPPVTLNVCTYVPAYHN